MRFEKVELGEYIKIQGGYAYKSDDFDNEGEFPVIKIKNVRFGNVDYSDTSYISDELADETIDWKTREGDILISMTGSGPNAPNSLVGRVARIWEGETDAWINQRVGRILLNDVNQIHPDFIFYLLTSHDTQHYLVSNSTGSANQANISGKLIESIPSPRIDYETSKRIADQLRALDQKIHLNQQMNETLEGMAQSIFKSWFVDFDPVHAKIKAIADGQDPIRAAMAAIAGVSLEQAWDDIEADLQHKLDRMSEEQRTQLQTTAKLFPDELVDSELGEVPRGWEYSTIDNEFDIEMGQSPPGSSYNDEGKGEPFYQGRTDFGFRFPTQRIYCTDPKRFAKKGDTLLSVRAPVGDLNIAIEDCCIGRGLSSIRHKSGSSSYTYYAMKKVQSQIESYEATGTVFGSINQKQLKSLDIISPDGEIIREFHRISEAFDAKIMNQEFMLRELSQLRDTLLPKLISGEIEV